MNSGADRRAGQQSGADGAGSQQSAAGLGAVGAESRARSISASTSFRFGRAALAARCALEGCGGWQLNGIATLLSGFPFTPLIGSNRSGDGDTRNPDRPSLNPAFTGPVVLGNPNQWFNPNAFVLPTPGTYGDLGRGDVLAGPASRNWMFRCSRTTKITERDESAISRGVFQRVESREFRDAECDRVFRRGVQSVGGVDDDDSDDVAADSVWVEADFLASATPEYLSPRRRKCR